MDFTPRKGLRIKISVFMYNSPDQCQFLADVNSRSRSLYAIADPSVVCLSVTLVHPTQPVEIFGNFLSPYDSPGTQFF